MKLHKIIIFVFILVLLGFLVKVGFDRRPLSLFSVKKIDCKTQYGPCLEEETKLFQRFLNQNLFLISNDQVKRELLQDPKNAFIFVQKVFPNVLLVSIERKRAYVGIRKNSLTKNIFLTSKDGVVVALVENTPLPILEVADTFPNPQVAETIPENAVKAAKILYFAYKGQEAKIGFLEKDTLRVLLKDGPVVYFPVDGDPEILAGALQLTLSRSKMQNILPKEIDLRYSNPVLRY